jgi:hypothetical protein
VDISWCAGRAWHPDLERHLTRSHRSELPIWQHSGDEPVAFTAPSLTHPDSPPFPGFAVATRPDFRGGESQDVAVLVQVGERPDLTLIHMSVLYVGRAGVKVGNTDSGLTHINLRTGDWPIEIWVDATDPAEVSCVVFVLTEPSA